MMYDTVCYTTYIIYTSKNVEELKRLYAMLDTGMYYNSKGKRIYIVGDKEEERVWLTPTYLAPKENEIWMETPIFKAPHGYFFEIKMKSVNTPRFAFIEALLSGRDDMHYIYIEESGRNIEYNEFRTNDVHQFAVKYSWLIDGTLDEEICDERPELEFINTAEADDEETGRNFLQRVLGTDEEDPKALIKQIDAWYEEMEKRYPNCIAELYAKHICYDHTKTATVNIW